MTPTGDPLAYYASPGPMTDPGPHAPLFAGLPTAIPDLVRVVQGLLVHIFWAERQGLMLPDERKQEVQLRLVADKLARIQALDGRPLAEPRPLDKKLVANCRDFSVTLCAMLRCQGIPARARAGFGTYFTPGHYEDHWVCEYWHAGDGRWVMVDSQLDALQRQALEIDFDPLDMPPGRFLTGGQAWQMCVAGEADPDCFGIFDMHGLWFVRGDLLRDFWALQKLEILPWDGGWGFLASDDDVESEVMDRVAALTVAGDGALAQIRALYAADPRFHVPAELLTPAGQA